MVAVKKKLDFKTVTVKCKSKKRFVTLDDESVIKVLHAAGKKLSSSSRIPAPAGFRCVGVFALPTNNVVEVFESLDGSRRCAFLFHNIDVWMTYAQVAS